MSGTKAKPNICFLLCNRNEENFLWLRKFYDEAKKEKNFFPRLPKINVTDIRYVNMIKWSPVHSGGELRREENGVPKRKKS